MKKITLLLTLIVATYVSNAQVRMFFVEPIASMIGFKNFGSTPLDVSQYWICHNGNYELVDSTLVIQGTKTIAPGDSLMIRLKITTMNITGSDLAFYRDTAFSDTASMKDFVEWGGPGHGREAVAVAKGIWGAGDYITAFPPYAYLGNGTTDWGVFWWGVPNPPITNFGLTEDFICQNDTVTFTDSTIGVVTNYDWDFGPGAIPATANTAGPHNVVWSSLGLKFVKLVCTNSLGVDSTTKQVTVTNFSPITISGPSFACGSDPLILDAGAGSDSYVWSTGDTTRTINAMVSGNYSVTITTGSCFGVDSVDVERFPSIAKPTLNYNSSTGVLSVDSTYDGYLWFRDTVSFSSVTWWVDVTQNGTYWVLVSDTNNCTAYSDTLMINTIGIDLQVPAPLEIHPNPATSAIRIIGLDVDQVELVSILGETKRVQVRQGRADVRHLPPGFYIVRATMRNQAVQGKFIKQ
jgi:hypothetical protein